MKRPTATSGSEPMIEFEPGDLPRSRPWHILAIMRRGDRVNRPEQRNVWVALLIDVDADVFRASSETTLPGKQVQSCWLNLGRHKKRDDACEFAEQLIATRH